MNAIQLADYLRINYRTLIDLLNTDYKDMPRTKVKGEWVFDKDRVMVWIEKQFN